MKTEQSEGQADRWGQAGLLNDQVVYQMTVICTESREKGGREPGEAEGFSGKKRFWKSVETRQKLWGVNTV